MCVCLLRSRFGLVPFMFVLWLQWSCFIWAGSALPKLGRFMEISMQLFYCFLVFFFIPLRMSVAHLNTTVAAAGDVYISICVCRSASATTLITHNRAFSSRISICAWRQHIGFLFSQSVWITIINKAPLYAHSPWVSLSLWDWILLHFITHMHISKWCHMHDKNSTIFCFLSHIQPYVGWLLFI